MKEFITILVIMSLSFLAPVRADDAESIRESLAKAKEYLPKDPSLSIRYASEALGQAAAIKSDALMAEAGNLIANSYFNLGDYVSGFEYLMEAEGRCPKEELALKADILLGISYSYLKAKDFDNAFRYIDRSMEIFSGLRDTAAMARCENNKGLICIAIPDNEAAGRHFLESLRLNRAIGNKTGVAQNMNNLSFTEEDPAVSIPRLKEAIVINEALDRPWILGENYNNLGYQYLLAGDPEAAMDALSKARSYADRTNAGELLMDNLRYRSETHARLGEYGMAYEDLKELLDRIETQDLSGGLKDVEVGLMKKNIQSILKEKERSEKEARLKWTVASLVAALLLAFCAIIIISYILYRKTSLRQVEMLKAQKTIDAQEKEIMRKELEFNRKELEDFALYLRSRNELMSGIQDGIREIYGMEPDEATPRLKKLNSSISRFNRSNGEAEKLIDKVNSGFIMKLSALHPDLSRSDKRLASLLRVGLSSKDISIIMSMEPKSVDMARYRLRKKLNLDANESLYDFLCRI